MENLYALAFKTSFEVMAQQIHEVAKEKGWWDNAENRNLGEFMANIHREVSEAWEGLRCNNPPDKKLPKYTTVEVELADAIIWIMDLAHYEGYRIAEAIIDKTEYNKTREHKHGKLF